MLKIVNKCLRQKLRESRPLAGRSDYFTHPKPTLLVPIVEVATDVSARFWVNKHQRGLSINQHADTGVNLHGKFPYLETDCTQTIQINYAPQIP